MAAVGAQKLNRPVRLALTKDDDMVITGKRNPFKNDFKVGFDENGKITALEVKLFSDGGATRIYLQRLWSGPCFIVIMPTSFQI